MPELNKDDSQKDKPSTRPATKHKQYLPTVIVIAVGTIVIFGFLTLKPAPETVKPSPVPAPIVNVIEAQPKTETLVVISQGTVTPRTEIDLVVQVAGKIEKVQDNFVDGGFFQAGEPLLQIEPNDYQLAVIKAKARVADTEQILALEKGRARQARREWKDLGTTEANDLFLRKPQLAAAQAQLAAAEADLDMAKLNLQRTKVTVPFNGRIRTTNVDLGQYVTPGTPVAKVYDTARAEIRLPLTDRQVALVDLPLGFKTGQRSTAPSVLIKGTIGSKQYTWQGEIVRTDASLDTNSRLYYAVVEVSDPFIQHPEKNAVPLIVGLFVDAEINGKAIQDVIEIPRRALFKNSMIYSVSSDNRVQIKQVQVLSSNTNTAWIQGDIQAGERIIVGRQNFLSEGLQVSPTVTTTTGDQLSTQ